MSVPQNETVLETIERRLIPDEQAKKARGEVFTPLNVVRELLFGLRKSDLEAGKQVLWGVDSNGDVFEDDESNRIGGIPLELWRDPDTRWLDPANGIGNFPFIAFHMLDYQLKTHGAKGSNEWDDEKRKKHIVENMLCMVEIDRGNVNTTFKVMDYLAPGSKPRICCADTLKLNEADFQRHFGASKFDVVMGNPPFNTQRITKGQTGTLWDKFILMGLQQLSPQGVLAFITPQLWRKPEHKLYFPMTRDNHLHYLRIMGERETTQAFHVGSRVDLYIIAHAQSTTPTSTIIDETGVLTVIDVHEFPFLPNYMIDTIRKILIEPADGIKVMHDRTMYGHDKRNVSRTKDDTFKLPVMNSMTQKGNVPLYANADKGHFGVPKVILSVGRNQYPYNDFEGVYGLSDSVFGIPIQSKEEGDAIVDAINSDQFKEIIKATKWGTYQTEHRMFKYFRPDFWKQFLKKPEGGGHVTPRAQKGSRRTRRVFV